MIGYIDIICQHCGIDCKKSTGHYNRAIKMKANLFCSKLCAGEFRKTTKAEKIEVKRIYDIKYSKENAARIKERGQIYNRTPKGRAVQKRQREKNKESHREYIKSDRYVAWKRDYDQKYHAKNNYGEFWESSLILKEIDKHIDNYEVKLINQTLNKSQKRKRYDKVNSK